jgi:SAM-dependent methyltransferase
LLNSGFLNSGDLCEKDLTLARKKPTPFIFRLSYRLKRMTQAVVGRKSALQLCLTASWLIRRFAYELSCDLYGHDFQQTALALTREDLQKWIPPGGSVIDIGCGNGRWARVAANYAQHVVGIDHDASNIEAARSMSSGSEIEYIIGDVNTDLTDRRFDTGLLIHLIEHIDDPDRLLRSLHKLVDTIIVEVPDFESDCLNLVRLELGSPFYTDGDHVREYTLPILKEQLERNGWKACASRHHGGAILVVARRIPEDATKQEVQLC